MQQRKALQALVMLLALLTFNTEVQAKGGRGGGGGRSSGGGRRSGGHHSSSSGGGFWSNLFGGGSKSSSTSSHKNSDSSSSSSHSTGQNSKVHSFGGNSRLNKPITPSRVGNHHSKPTHGHHATSYPKQPVFMTSRIPGAPPPPPPPYGGYYASSSSLPVGSVYYPQVPRRGSDPGFANGFFAGAYGQSILDRLSHVHYYGGHRSVIHHYHQDDNNSNNNNNGGKDTIIILNNNPATEDDLEEAKTTTTTTTTTPPLETLDTQYAQIKLMLNDLENWNSPMFEAQINNLLGIKTSGPDGNGLMGPTLNDDISTAASNAIDDDDQTNNTVAPPGGIICFPSIVNETDAQDNNKVMEVEKIFCFPSEPPALTPEELEAQQQPPEQPNILNDDQPNSTARVSNHKGSFQFAGVMVLLYLSIF